MAEEHFNSLVGSKSAYFNMQSEKNTILVIGALPSSLINFRRDLLKAFLEDGYRVVAMAGSSDSDVVSELSKLGVAFRPYPVARSGTNPLSDLATLVALYKSIKQIQPVAVVAYTIKPVIYSGIACRIIQGPRFVPMITGLGFAMSGKTFVRRLLSSVMGSVYRFALGKAHRVVFQNRDNLNEFVDRGIVSRPITKLVNGSGVDLQAFRMQRMPPSPPKFLMVARLLKDKGVFEFCEAARMVKEKYPEAQFKLAGPVDPSPNGIKLSDLTCYQQAGTIDYIGSLSDVRESIASCHVFVLPSYHEGRSRTVQEALAIGRYVVTTDAPGCRDSIEDGVTGSIVPVANALALANCLGSLIDNFESWARDPRPYRQYSEENYDSVAISKEIVSLVAV